MQNKNSKTIKIAHYNIYNGGTKRLSKISKVIEEINPDICGLLECVGWENNIERYTKYFKSKGYNFFYLAKANSKYNISIISKIKIKTTSVKSGVRHVIAKAEITEPECSPLHIFFLHLSPKSEEERLKEILILLKQIKTLDRVIIMGDFNSLSKKDKYNEKLLLEKLKKNGVTKFGKEYLKFDVINKIEGNNFIDAFRYKKNKFTYSAPSKYNTDINHSEKIRIDYAFIKQEIAGKVKACKIFKSKTTELASDHYPLYIEIEKR